MPGYPNAKAAVAEVLAFNSLFEMPGTAKGKIPSQSTKSFNSLFEMRLGTGYGYASNGTTCFQFSI